MIPGSLVAMATFPGIIAHEMAHVLFCRLFRVSVLQVCYFRIGNPAGCVVHETPRSVYHSLMIAVGPFVANSAAGLLIAAPVTVSGSGLRLQSLLHYFLVWLAVSVAMHAFPSTGDAKAMWRAMWSKGSPALAKLVGTPLVLLIYAGAVGSVAWLDLAYGIAVAILVPKLLVSLLA